MPRLGENGAAYFEACGSVVMGNGFRWATAEDSKALVTLWEELHRYHVGINPERHKMPNEYFFADMMKNFLGSEDYAVILHETAGNTDAYAVLFVDEFDNPDEHTRKVCFIEHFMVTESTRGQGIGTALFREIREYARAEKCDFIRLGVNAKNPTAIEFYKKMGLIPQSINMEMKL